MNIYELLPDDLLDYIYSKIIYKNNTKLLEDIKKFPLIKSWLYFIYNTSIYDITNILNDLVIEYIVLIEKKENNLYYNLNELLYIVNNFNIYYYINNENIKNNKIKALKIIKNLMMDLEPKYIEYIVEPIIAHIK